MREPVTAAGPGRKGRIYTLSATALMTAVTCILAPLSLPIGPVPVTLTNLVINLSLYLLGWRCAAVSCAVYILLGLAGLPVFSGFSGGFGKLAGPTGGYIIGFLPMAVAAGLIISHTKKRILHFLAMAAGTALCYALGTAWFCVVMDASPAAALAACVLPFIPGDILKMLLALLAGPAVRKRIRFL